MELFSWPLRVYYEDTDTGGVVYYANYLRFMERCRTEWLRSLGIEQDRLISEYDVLFAVRHVDVDYRRPARFNDQLEITSRLVEQGRASLSFEQTVLRVEGADKTELVHGQVKIACLSASKFRPCPIPEFIQTEIARVC